MKQQIILSVGGILLLCSLFFFGKTTEKKISAVPVAMSPAETPVFNINDSIQSAKQKLSIEQASYVNKLENSVSRGDVKDQQINVSNQLATFWKDSTQQADIYYFYTAQAAKLVNTKKSLTFAAQLILEGMRNEGNPAKKNWEASQSIELFEKAIDQDPTNDSLKIGLASCYIFGTGMMGGPQETMKGIMQLLDVVHRDSTNMQAQLVLGIGGVISGQYDKALDRLNLVVKTQPKNVEAISWLADAYAGKGDKADALKWYKISKRMVNNVEYSKEVDERIKMLQ